MEENSMKDKKRFVCANAFYEGREYYYCLKKIPSYNWTMLFLVSADHVATNTMDNILVALAAARQDVFRATAE